jgi:hypothetical protein
MNNILKNYFKFVAKIIVRLGLKNPSMPHLVGAKLYRLKSFFPESFENCPCDKDFFDYLVDSKIKPSAVFHFGTGDHHHIGLKNLELKRNHTIYGITAAVSEMKTYMQHVLNNPQLSHHYKVLFTDIYCLNSTDLSTFDYVNLFHLCEFTLENSTSDVLYNDAGLIELMLKHLKEDGRFVFYRHSAAAEKAKKVINTFVQQNVLTYTHSFKSLDFYKTTDSKS